MEKWTKNVNIFEKDFLIVPINKNSHWYLAIICFPYLTEAEFVQEKKDDLTAEIADPFLNELEMNSENSNSSINSKKPATASKVLDNFDNNIFGIDEADSGESNHSFSDPKEKGMCRKRPIILIFDSLPSTSKKRVIATLKE